MEAALAREDAIVGRGEAREARDQADIDRETARSEADDDED
jgi:hypothetical protein